MLPKCRLLPGRAGDAADDDPLVGRPVGQQVAVGAVPQDPGQVRDRRFGVDAAVRGQRRPPAVFAELVDPGLGALVDRPADRVLDLPAPSMLTSTSLRQRPGIWPNAASRTSRWSAAVNEPAFPGRSITARLSPTLVQNAVNGWNP